MVNTRVCKTLNDSSSLSLPLFCIAQLVEQWPFKPPVLGSSPSAIINHKYPLSLPGQNFTFSQ
jgi:hypothetical protein